MTIEQERECAIEALSRASDIQQRLMFREGAKWMEQLMTLPATSPGRLQLPPKEQFGAQEVQVSIRDEDHRRSATRIHRSTCTTLGGPC